jgi:hypothetical protein
MLTRTRTHAPRTTIFDKNSVANSQQNVDGGAVGVRGDTKLYFCTCVVGDGDVLVCRMHGPHTHTTHAQKAHGSWKARGG